MKKIVQKQLGELLVESKLITPEHLAEGLQVQKEKGGLIGQVLVNLGYATEEDIAKGLMAQYGTPYIPLANYEIDAELAKVIPETGAELAAMRGIFFPWAKRHGDAFTGKLVRVSAAATKEGFVPLEPPPYNTFERIRAEGWIRKAAAEVCVELSLAPELAFPERVTRRMIDAVEAKKTNAAAAELLTGWRERVLRTSFQKHGLA